jgi:hypothetical protein
LPSSSKTVSLLLGIGMLFLVIGVILNLAVAGPIKGLFPFIGITGCIFWLLAWGLNKIAKNRK